MFKLTTKLRARSSEGVEEPKGALDAEVELGDDDRSLSATFVDRDGVAIADVLLEFQDGELKLRYWGHNECDTDPTTVVLLTKEEVLAHHGFVPPDYSLRSDHELEQELAEKHRLLDSLGAEDSDDPLMAEVILLRQVVAGRRYWATPIESMQEVRAARQAAANALGWSETGSELRGEIAMLDMAIAAAMRKKEPASGHASQAS